MDSAPLTALITMVGTIIMATMRWVVNPWIKQRSAMIEAVKMATEVMMSVREELTSLREKIESFKEFREATVYRPKTTEGNG